MPFITEEIWQRFGIGESIAVSSWPTPHPEHVDADAESSFGVVQEIVTAVRQFRSRHGISPKARFEARVGLPPGARAAVDALAERIERLAGVSPLEVVDPAEGKRAGWSSIPLREGFVNLPPGLFDAQAERSRLSKRRDEISSQLDRTTAKLGNAGFLAKAAPEIVAQEQEKRARLAQQLAEIEDALAELEA